jgi:hypothetical protein
MLIEKTIDTNDVISIKLTTQEEIICKLAAQDATTVTVQRPLSMNLSMDERTGRPAIQMLPFFLLGAKPDAKLVLQRSHILVMTVSNDEAKAGYIHNTSGLTIPTSSESSLII